MTTTQTGWCPNCNHKVLLRRGCCVHCGTLCQVSSPKQQQVEHQFNQGHPDQTFHPASGEKSSFCALCGTKLDIRNQRFCPNCGAEL